jgi:hypothetical protein
MPRERLRGIAMSCHKVKRSKHAPFTDAWIEERVRVEPEHGCWMWLGAVNPEHLYGQLMFHGRTMNAHRAFYIHCFGELTSGEHALHTCDRFYPAGDMTYRRCVNPSHVFVGSNLDNIADMVAKGRNSRGERHHCATLSDERLAELLQRAAEGERQSRLAREFLLSPGHVSRLVHGSRRGPPGTFGLHRSAYPKEPSHV